MSRASPVNRAEICHDDAGPATTHPTPIYLFTDLHFFRSCFKAMVFIKRLMKRVSLVNRPGSYKQSLACMKFMTEILILKYDG